MKTIFPFMLMAVMGILFVTSPRLRASDMDDRIELSAQKSYIFKTFLRNDFIKAESRDGFVTLTGTVAEASHKAMAQSTVESLPGVTSVDNQLHITGDQPIEYSDTWIGMKVQSALLFNHNVNAFGTTVNVTKGVVTLQGEAANLAQKDLTTACATDVDSVKSVINEMSLATTPAKRDQTLDEKIDDASVTAQVKWSLLAHHSTSALKAKIETADGVVTVSGIARNSIEKNLVTKLVFDIDGVTHVNNNMTVAITTFDY